MYEINNIINTIINGDVLDELKKIPDESIDMCITSPPYWNLRDYEHDNQIGNEKTYQEYLLKLDEIYKEVYRILKKKGSCWVNIGDVYYKSSLLGLPDRFKINMIDNGWICRNEIIWHKPNAMPSSAKNRFNNDYEKMFFFTKDNLYYFETQYEEAKTKNKPNKSNNNNNNNNNNTKYKNLEQESSVRQGMNRDRGNKIIEVRPKLPTQEEFVNYLRSKTTIKKILNNTDLPKTKIEHWFRRDEKGFSYPSVDDWNKIKTLLCDNSEEFNDINNKLTYVELQTDDIYKNINKGRIKRSVWSINTKPFKKSHFAVFPEELVEIPIKACCPINGIVLDIFMGSGTTGVVAKKLNRNYIGIELNKGYCEMAKERIETK